MIRVIKSSLAKLDIHTLEVLKKSSSSLLVKILGMVAAFVVSIILGRTIGPDGLGIITLANQIVSIVLIFGMLGMDNVILKEISISYENKDWQHITNTIYTALRINIPLALSITVIFIYLAPWLTINIFNEPALNAPLIIALLVVLPQIVSRIFASGINGFRKIWQSNLVNDTLSVGVVAIGLIILLFFKIQITIINVAILYALGRVVVMIAVTTYWNHLFKFSAKRNSVSRKMLKVALPLLAVSATNMISSNADTVMLGWLSNTREVGFYSVAARLALLTSFFHIVTTSSLTPKIASLYGQNKTVELQKMVQQVTKGLGLIGFAGVIVFVFAGKFILSLWGNEFTIAYFPLIIIAIGQFFNIATGATGIILIMSGNEKLVGYVSIFAVILNLLLNYIFIPKYGAVGAAFTTAITISFSNLIKLLLVKWRLKIWTIPFINN
ncbi:flippase [Algoriphagus namhaensis]|uniref:Flippase n=1 Tax=Algoriphagus namhaensis TaxID=915353 RepID=A0ABV8ATK9_9BACT